MVDKPIRYSYKEDDDIMYNVSSSLPWSDQIPDFVISDDDEAAKREEARNQNMGWRGKEKPTARPPYGTCTMHLRNESNQSITRLTRLIRLAVLVEKLAPPAKLSARACSCVPVPGSTGR